MIDEQVNPTAVAQGFEDADPMVEESSMEQGFADAYDAQEAYFSERQTALNTTTMLTALATTDPSKNISYQMGEQTLEEARKLLKAGQEKQFRYQLVLDKVARSAEALGGVIEDLKYAPDPGLAAGAQQAYHNVLQFDTARREKTAIEEAAIERIQTMAATDPVQARVLLNNLEYGNADETVRQFNVKLSLLKQRAEELDDTYQQSGWGRFALNLALNLVPTNFNFARTGIVGEGASIGDFFAVGATQREESENLWNMPLDEFADYTAKNGPLMQSIADNATSFFEIADPGAAVEIMDNLTSLGDSDRVWNNIWGGVEIASVVPWGKLASASRTLVTSGAAKDAVRNLDNALTILDARGPEAMTKSTGVVEKEIADELSVSAIKGTDDFVPLSEPVAAHREAAEQASKEILNSPEMSAFRSIEELQDWIVGRVDEIRARIGSPIKDIHMKPTQLAGGNTAYRLVFTVGKKDGFGYATEAAAKRGVAAMGFRGSAQIVEEGGRRVITEVTEPALREKLGKHLAARMEREFEVNRGLREGEEKIAGNENDLLSPELADEADEAFDNWVDNLDELTKKRFRKDPAEGERAYEEFLENFHADQIEKTQNVVVKSPQREIAKGRDPRTANDAINDNTIEIRRDMSGQFFAKIEVDMPQSGWLVGKLTPPQQGFVSRMVGRWFQAAPRVSDTQLHGQAIQAGTYLNRAQRNIQEHVFNVFRDLPKQSRDVVRALGEVQAIRARWLKPNEIDVLTQRQWGRAATEAEQKAMGDLRLFNDMDWEMRNTAQYLDGINKGKESVKFKAKWGQEFDEDVVIDYNMTVTPIERVYDTSRGKHYVHGRNSLDTKTLTTMKNNGYVMMTFPEGFALPEGIIVNKVLIKKVDVDISPLRTTQLAYSEGGHRMYTAPVFVKQGRKGVQADTGTSYLKSPSTFRTAENIGEGKKWAEVMNRARLAVKENKGLTAQELDDDIFKNRQGFPSGEEFLAGISDETYALDEPFEALYDRELPSLYNTSGEDVSRMFNEDELGINGYYRTTGRMYTSSKGEILRDTTGELAEILDPYDTLNRSLNQVTRQLGMYTYKQNAIERFVNTYKGFLQADPALRSPSQVLMEGRVSNTTSVEMRNQIESQRAAILNVLRFETPADRASKQMWQSLTERVLGDGDNVARKAAHDAIWWFRNKDPIGAMRGLAFDMKLGMFNIGQLLVQSSTMASALALSPKFAAFGMAGLYPMHTFILKGGSEAVLDTMSKRGTWKAMGFSGPNEFKDFARHAYRNGFMEMNGSHIMINNHGPSSHFGGFAEKANSAREQARVFFYTSETWNRLVAYRIAWGEAMTKGLKPNQPDFDSFILKTADDYSFNMTSESAAYWQKGILSIPTQFWAYNMRMMDAMFGTRFTPAQRARLIGMNLGMAGAAGIPGLAGLAEYIKQTNGEAPNIESLAGVADRGLIDYINFQMTGADVLIGERVGTGGWATDVVKSLFGQSAYGEQSFIDIAGGATYSIAKSTSKTLYNLGKYAVAESGAEDAGEITSENLINLFKEVSTFSNASKALLIHQYGMLKSNKGTVMVTGLPPSHAAYAALSFRPAKAEEIGYLLSYSQNKADALKDFSKQLRNWRQEALTTGDYEKYWTKANTLMRLVPIADRQTILKQANSLDDASFYDYLEEKVADEQAEEEVMEGLE